MTDIYDSLVSRVKMDWPATLDKWDMIQDQLSALYDYIVGQQNPSFFINDVVTEPAGVICFTDSSTSSRPLSIKCRAPGIHLMSR